MSKKKTGRRIGRFTGIVIFLCLFVFASVCYTAKVKELKHKAAVLDEQIEQTENELAEARLAELEVEIRNLYVKSDTYIEQLARRTFNLVRPGDRLYIIEWE